ncbi:MAG: hypothetical protein ACTSWF_04165 [Candidatus Freyarchaeota archaeon]
MGFWNGVNVERVYGRLRVLALVFALPAAASMLYLLGLDNSKIFLLFQTAERFYFSLTAFVEDET